MRGLELAAGAPPSPRSLHRHTSIHTSSDEEDGLVTGNLSGRFGKAFLFSLALAGSALGGFLIGQGARGEQTPQTPQAVATPQAPAPAESEPQSPRILESEEFGRLAAEHTLAFHKELGLPLDELSPEMRSKLHRELSKEASLKVEHTLKHMEVDDQETARKLRDMRVTPEQWQHAQQILDAMHDKRVQAIGKSVSQTMSQSSSPSEPQAAAQRQLEGDKAELSGLAEELLPKDVRKAQSEGSWAMTVNNHAVRSEGPIGDWHAVFEVAPPQRRLQAPPPAPAPAPGSASETGIPAWLVTTMAGLYVTVGTMGGILVGIISVLLSAIADKAGALGVWWTYVGLNIAECGVQLGMTIGIADLRAWWQWVPCWLMSCFTGLESIWVLRK